MAAHPWLNFPAIIIFFISFSLKAHFCIGADRITQNQSLYVNQTLISAGSRFELGFFKPRNSSNYYLGIWFYKVSKAVWVANRESPILNHSSAVLRFSGGNLALFSDESGQVPIWSTDSSTPCRKAVLQDDGNLVLTGDSDDQILWQSFDNPTDTLLPGAKLGHNKIKGKYITMVPWRSEDDPAPGDFSLQLDPNGTNQIVVLRNKSTLHWTSGLWNGRFFSTVPEMMWKNIYDFVYVDNENEAYYAYSVLNKSLIFRKSVSQGGNFQVLLWNQNWNLIWSQPRSQCQVQRYCGAFGSCADGSSPSCYCLEGFVPKSTDEYSSNVFYNGCIRKSDVQCGDSRNGTKKLAPADKFIQGYAVRDNTSGSPTYRSLRNVQECESTCLDSCSCSAYAYEGYTCSIWSLEVYDIHSLADDPTGLPIYVRVGTGTELPSSGTKRMVLGAVFGSIAAVVLIGFLSFAILRWYRGHKLGKQSKLNAECHRCSFDLTSSLVRLLGCCVEKEEKILIYEYLPNRSLDKFLFDSPAVIQQKP